MVRIFSLVFTLILLNSNYSYTQDYRIFISEENAISNPIWLTFHYIDKVEDGYIGLHYVDSDEGPFPYIRGDLKWIKYDSSGHIISEKIILPESSKGFVEATPDCYKIGVNYRIVYLKLLTSTEPIIPAIVSLLYDPNFELLERTEIPFENYNCTGSIRVNYGSWKTVRNTTGHLTICNCRDFATDILCLYDENGYFIESKHLATHNSAEIYYVFDNAMDLDDSTFVVPGLNFYHFNQNWELLNTIGENKYSKNGDGESRKACIQKSNTGYFVFYGFWGQYLPINSLYSRLFSLDENLSIQKSIDIPRYYETTVFPWNSIAPRGGLYKTDDGNYAYMMSIDENGRCWCPDDTLMSYLARIIFDEDFNIICHKEYVLPEHKVRFNNLTDMHDGTLLLTGITDKIEPANLNNKRAFHPFFAYLPKNSCDIPWATEIYNVELGTKDVKPFDGTITCTPNPAVNHIRLDVKNRIRPTPMKLIVFNEMGQEMYSSVMNGFSTSVDISSFKPGTFFYLIIDENGSSTSGKFIKGE